MTRKLRQRRPVSPRARPKPERRERAELGPNDYELILMFTVDPYLMKDMEHTKDWDDEEETRARTFYVRTLWEPQPEVPWHRIAEVMSPFIIRTLGPALDATARDIQRARDVERDSSLVNMATIFGFARHEKPQAEGRDDAVDEAPTAFSGRTFLRHSFEGEERRRRTLVRISFEQLGEDEFEFEEGL